MSFDDLNALNGREIMEGQHAAYENAIELDGLAAAQSTDTQTPEEIRLKFLQKAYLQLADADQPYTQDVLDWVAHGGNLRLALYEIAQLVPPTQNEQDLKDAREAYADELAWSHKKGFDDNDSALASRNNYIEAVVDRMAAHIDAATDEEALVLKQMPTLVKKTVFAGKDDPLTHEVLTANHLAILLDIVLSEHVNIHDAVEQRLTVGRLNRVLSNHLVRLAIAGTVFGLSLVPKLHIVPTPDEYITEDIEIGLRLLTGLILFRELPTMLAEKIESNKRTRNHERRIGRLAAKKELCDDVLRMTYNSTRYGGRRPGYKVTGRHATDSPTENAKRLRNVEKEFAHLNNDPGGKLYSCDQALQFSERILAGKKDFLTTLLEEQDPVVQRGMFLELTRELLSLDLQTAERHMREGKVKKVVKNGLPILTALIVPEGAAVASEAKTIATDTVHQIHPRSASKHRTDDLR